MVTHKTVNSLTKIYNINFFTKKRVVFTNYGMYIKKLCLKEKLWKIKEYSKSMEAS